MKPDLPQASEMDVWLAGYVAGYGGPRLAKDAESDGLHLLHLSCIHWLRANNDAVALDCPELPELERRMGAAQTLEAKREALRALLAARDAVIAAKPAHDAVQAQAVMPLELGLHPTGIGGDQ